MYTLYIDCSLDIDDDNDRLRRGLNRRIKIEHHRDLEPALGALLDEVHRALLPDSEAKEELESETTITFTADPKFSIRYKVDPDSLTDEELARVFNTDDPSDLDVIRRFYAIGLSPGKFNLADWQPDTE